jgi:class 3 adenylate cyclase
MTHDSDQHLDEAVRRSGLLEGVGDWRRLLDPRIVTIPRGGYLCREGEFADALWIVVRGMLTVEAGGKFIELRRDGDVLGEGAYPHYANERVPRMASLRAAVTDVEVVAFPFAKLDAIPSDRPFVRNVARILSRKLNEATKTRAGLRAQVASLEDAIRSAGAARGIAHQRIHGAAFVEAEKVFWFSDVRSFSDSVEKLSPDRIAEFCQALLVPQAEAIAASGGEIDKYVGDGIMADWAVDANTRVRHVQGAVYSALQVSDQLRASNFDGHPMRLRIGLHLGKARCGFFGPSARSQFTSVGRAVNVAARLESAERDDVTRCDVRISEPVFELLGEDLKSRFQRFDGVKLKHIGEHTIYGAPPPEEK